MATNVHTIVAALEMVGLGKYTRDATKAAAVTQGMGAKMQGASKGALAMKAGAVGAAGAIAGLAAVSVKTAISFESAFAGVRKTVDATDAQFDMLRSGLEDLTTTIPSSFEELAGIAEIGGQLGVAQEDLLNFTETVAKIGETTNVAGEEAATAFARIANVMGEPISNIDEMASAVVALGNNFATTESEILGMANRMTAGASVVGMTTDEVFAMSASLSSLGVRAEAGGSAFSRVMQTMNSDIMEGGEALDVWAGTAGVTAEEFAAAFKASPVEALRLFSDGLGDVIAEGGNSAEVLGGLALDGIRTSEVMLKLATNTDLWTNALGMSATAMDENTALNEEAAKRFETTGAQVQLLVNEIRLLAADIGTALLPAFIRIVQVAQDVVQAIREIYETVGSFVDLIKGENLDEAWHQLVGGSDVFADAIEFAREHADALEQNGHSADRAAAGFMLAEESSEALFDRMGLVVGESRTLVDVIDGATSQVQEFGAVTDGVAELLGNAAEAVQDVSSAVSGAVSPLDAFTSAVDDIGGAGDNWWDYADGVNGALASTLATMEAQNTAIQNWGTNLTTIAERAGSEFANQLAALGPESAGLVAEIASASDEELGKAADVFGTQAGLASSEWAQGLLTEIGAMEANGAAMADGAIAGLQSRYGAAYKAAYQLSVQFAEGARAGGEMRSPSRLMAREVGIPLVEGVIAGVESMLGRVADSGKAIADSMATGAADLERLLTEIADAQVLIDKGGKDAERALKDQQRAMEDLIPTVIRLRDTLMDLRDAQQAIADAQDEWTDAYTRNRQAQGDVTQLQNLLRGSQRAARGIDADEMLAILRAQESAQQARNQALDHERQRQLDILRIREQIAELEAGPGSQDRELLEAEIADAREQLRLLQGRERRGEASRFDVLTQSRRVDDLVAALAGGGTGGSSFDAQIQALTLEQLRTDLTRLQGTGGQLAQAEANAAQRQLDQVMQDARSIWNDTTRDILGRLQDAQDERERAREDMEAASDLIGNRRGALTELVININAGIGADATQIAEVTIAALREWERENGPIPVSFA